MPRTNRALILAAGEGKRLRPWTDSVPKPLVPVNGRAILDRTLDALQKNGIERVTVVAGHLENVLRNHLANRREIDIIANPRFRETNSMFSLLLGLSHIDEAVWVIEADVVFDAALLDREPRFPITWIVDRSSRLEGAFVHADESDRATRVDIIRDPNMIPDGLGKSVGMLHVSREAVGTLRQWLTMDLLDRRENDYYDLTLGRRMPIDEVGVCDIAGARWYEVDTPEDLRRAEELFA
jgi:L-glutamine-phosphate cytidylyltransferase